MGVVTDDELHDEVVRLKDFRSSHERTHSGIEEQGQRVLRWLVGLSLVLASAVTGLALVGLKVVPLPIAP